MSILCRPKRLFLLSALMMPGFALPAYATEPAAAVVTPPAVTAPAAVVTPPAVTAPAEAPTGAPEKVATESPVVAPVSAPEKVAAESPAIAPVSSPEKVTAESPVVAPVNVPENVVAETPAVAPVKATEAAPVAGLPTTPATAPTKVTAPDDVTAESLKAVGIPAAPVLMLDSEEQKRAYASGVMLAHFIEEQMAEQKSLHITLNKNLVLAGIADTFSHQVQMSDSDIRQTMAVFDEQVKVLTQAQNEKKQAEDKAYIEAFAKREGVKKTKQGLLYHIDIPGTGAILKDTDTVQINYKGTLVDGTVVDRPKIDGANEIFRVANMPPVMRDSVKLIRKDGQITVVIPPATLEKSKDAKDPSPLNTVVIYTISVVDVNQAK